MRVKIKLALALFACSSVCLGAGEPQFAGKYKCEGYDPYLKTYYKGTLEITPQNTVYQIKMQYDTGEKMIGTAGLYENDTIAVVFQDIKDLKKIGLERYSYAPDRNRIQGYWVYLGKDQLGKEVCERES